MSQKYIYSSYECCQPSLENQPTKELWENLMRVFNDKDGLINLIEHVNNGGRTLFMISACGLLMPYSSVLKTLWI